MKYPLALSSWGKEEIDAIQNVIKTDRYTMGTYVERFEREFAKYVGSQYAVMVNSGSSANLLMIASLFFRKHGYRLQQGDEVIVPAVSWPTTYYPLQQYGLKVKFVDVDLETLNYDLIELALAVTDKTRAILAVNLLGNSNDFNAIQKIINRKNPNILLLEDNCESMGAEYNSKQTGTFGLMGTFSCFFSHHISTMEGGLVVTDDIELYHILLSLRAHGWTRNLPDNNLVSGEKDSNPFNESFKFVLPGYNVRPLEMSGAIGLEQLKKFPKFLEQRRVNAEMLFNSFYEEYNVLKDYFIVQKEIGKSSWFGFSMIVKPDAPFTREQVVERLTKDGIECRPIVAGNFAKNEVVKKYFNYEICGELSNANIIDTNGLFVGNHHIDMGVMHCYLYDALTDLIEEYQPK